MMTSYLYLPRPCCICWRFVSDTWSAIQRVQETKLSGLGKASRSERRNGHPRMRQDALVDTLCPYRRRAKISLIRCLSVVAPSADAEDGPTTRVEPKEACGTTWNPKVFRHLRHPGSPVRSLVHALILRTLKYDSLRHLRQVGAPTRAQVTTTI